MRNTAIYRGVKLIELEKATMALFQEAGVEGTKKIFCHVPAGSKNYPDGLSDDSHLQENGAICVAALFLRLLRGEALKTEEFAAEKADLTDLISREDHVVC